MKSIIIFLFAISRAADVTCLSLQVQSPLAPQREHSMGPKKVENLDGPYHAFYDVDGTVR